MWRLKGGVENGKEFDTHANCLGACFVFAGRIRIARESSRLAHCFNLTIGLARHVGCRRVVFVPKWRHSVSCRATCREIAGHVADTRKCRVG